MVAKISVDLAAEGTTEAMAAAEMAIGSSGAITGIEVVELIDSKSMTAAMEKVNEAVSAYQALNR